MTLFNLKFRSIGEYIHGIKVSNDHQSLMAHGQLWQAQMANMASIGHSGLGSNFQPSFKWPMAYPKVYILKFVFKAVFTQTSWLYTYGMCHVRTLFACSQFLHHTLITCTLHAVLAPFLHVLTYFAHSTLPHCALQ